MTPSLRGGTTKQIEDSTKSIQRDNPKRKHYLIRRNKPVIARRNDEAIQKDNPKEKTLLLSADKTK